MLLIAQTETIVGRIPVIHFFDGFRTSHEFSKIASMDDIISAMLSQEHIASNRKVNASWAPDYSWYLTKSKCFFQARETINPYYNKFPDIVSYKMALFTELTGRNYEISRYRGSANVEGVIVIMLCC